MARRSRVRGVNSLRRKLRRMPELIQREVKDPLRDGLNRIGRDARGLAPVDSGDLRAAIDVKLSRDGLSGIVGPGAAAAEIVRTRTGSIFGQNAKSGKNKGQPIRLSKNNKKLYFQMLKGYWNEFGTKGNADKNIPAQPARPFMRPAREINMRRIKLMVSKGINAGLRRAARG